MVQIDYYFSVLSPFTYLAGVGLEEIAARRGAKVVYKPLDIMTLFTSTGGTPPKDRHWSRQEYRIQEMKRTAAYHGLPINMKPAHWPTNPLPMSTALISAQAAGHNVGAAAHAATRAVWAEEKDIADPAVVREVMSLIGVDASAYEAQFETAQAEYQRNTQEAVDGGVFGAPTYVVGTERFWGGDRLSYLDRHLAGLATAAA